MRSQRLDVSAWQGRIDWQQVATSGRRFVLIRATLGTLISDSAYADNRAGAKAAGLVVGAYHHADPQAISGDALMQADHFLDVAQPALGELLPVLDLETTNGLSPADLVTWTMTWLERVRSKLGVQAMIYTSPHFWQTALGDSLAFIQAGYRFLWVANWDVAAPLVPAQSWGGIGWTFWQYSSCGTVPGISGCVDLDRFAGSSIGPSLFVSLSAQQVSIIAWLIAWFFPGR